MAYPRIGRVFVLVDDTDWCTVAATARDKSRRKSSWDDRQRKYTYFGEETRHNILIYANVADYRFVNYNDNIVWPWNIVTNTSQLLKILSEQKKKRKCIWKACRFHIIFIRRTKKKKNDQARSFTSYASTACDMAVAINWPKSSTMLVLRRCLIFNSVTVHLPYSLRRNTWNTAAFRVCASEWQRPSL